MIARRPIVIAGGSTLVGGSRLAPAQAARPMRIGYLTSTRPDSADVQALVDAFQSELRRQGWTDARVVYLFRHADGVLERFPPLARELVALEPDVIFAGSSGAVEALRAATSTIPVVFVTPDPVEERQIASLARPGRNLTGLSFLSLELIGKRMQLLKEAFPHIVRVAYLGFEHPTIIQRTHAAAKAFHLELLPSITDRAEELPAALAAHRNADAWFIGDHLTYFANRRVVVDAIAAQRKPAIYPQTVFVHAGGLMAYATDLRALYRRAAIFIDKILRGAKPADLPVEQPTKFDLAINLRTARALGLTLPSSVLLRADEVIE